MNIQFRVIYIVLLLFVAPIVNAQKFEFYDENEWSQTLDFELINNLIILPVELNGNSYSFILDSGVSTPVIFQNLSEDIDSLEVKDPHKIKLRGLGEGDPVEALISKGNSLKMGKISSESQDLFIIYSDKLDLFAKLGVDVNGIIGHSIFNEFVITIDYIGEKITFTKPERYEYKACRRCEVFDLTFYKKKPLIDGEIIVDHKVSNNIPVQLLIDTGGTDALWLFEDEERGITVPERSFEDFIGEGISGGIFGRRSRIKSFALKDFVIREPNVAYLDSISTVYARGLKSRNGSLGGEVLRRFKVIMDYPNKTMTLKKNRDFHDKFNYNMSGIELIHGGKSLILVKELKRKGLKEREEDYNEFADNTIIFDYDYGYRLKPTYKIAYIRKGSPAEYAGLMEGDRLVQVNGKFVYNFKLKEIVENFYEREGKLIRMIVEREGQNLNFEFRLKSIL